MYLATINNQFDNKMKGLEIDKKVWTNVLNLIKNPLIVTDKAQIPQWKFCTVKGENRCTENIGVTNILILDFDDKDYTYQEFEKRFREYRYIIHTSHSYDGTNNKFRVLLFMDKEYEIDKLFAKCYDKTFSPYEYLMRYFPHIDPASFVKAQFFKMPAVKSKDAPYYYNIHNGKLWSPEAIEGFPFAYTLCEQKQDEYIRNLERERAKKRTDNQDLSRAIDFVKRKLAELPAGMRHNGVFGIAAWFAGIGGSYEEFRNIEKPAWADRAYDKQIKRLALEWHKLGR